MRTFWDLEETVIESFTDPILVNKDRLKILIDHFSITSIDIFSFAIWNSHDKAIFDIQMKDMIEQTFDIQIGTALLMDDVNMMFRKKTGLVMDSTDFSALLGKHGAFIEFAKMSSAGNESFLLVDDAVDNMTLHIRDTNTTIHLVNITNFEVSGLPI